MANISTALIFVVAFTAITSLMIDFALCDTSRTDPSSSQLDCVQKAFFVSMLSPGAAVGSIIAGVFSDIFGRRRGLMLGDVLIATGSLCFALGKTYGVLLLGRFIIGIGIGVGFVVFAIYIPEVAPAQQRGCLVAAQDCALSVGCLLSYAVVALIPVEYWRALLGSVGVVATFQFIGCFCLPESPRWLVRRRRPNDAVVSVLRLLPKSTSLSKKQDDDCPELSGEATALSRQEVAEDAVRRMAKEFHEEIEMRRLHRNGEPEDVEHRNEKKAQRDAEPSAETGGVSSGETKLETTWARVRFALTQCWKYRARVGVAVGCAVAQNFTVSNSVLYFSLDVLNEAGIKDKLLAGVGVGLVKFLGVLCAILLVDRLGRRRLLLWGSIATCVCLFLFSAFFAAKNWGNVDMPWVAIPIMLVYIFGWNISWAGLMFVVASEVLPTTVRGIGMGLTITVFWLLSFLFQSVLEATMSAFTMQGAFLFFGCLNIFSVVFVVFCVHDLTGVALEDVAAALLEDSRCPGTTGTSH